jgi:2-iminoacetate synthase ThiH
VSIEKKDVISPYYAYGIIYLSENFHAYEKSKGADYHAYRKAWVDRVANQDHGAFPLNLNLEVTTRCNLACTFCSQPSLKKEQLGDMSWESHR